MTARRRHPAQNHAAQMHAALRQRTAARLEDYRWLRDEVRLGARDAARRLGVSLRTAERYEAATRRLA